MAGTIEINGTGGIIEGNLGAANVDVNLDYVGTYSGSDRVTVSHATAIQYSSNTDNTWSCWINASGLGGNNNGRIFDKSTAYMYLTTDGSTGYNIAANIAHSGTNMNIKTSTSYQFNVWYHVALVYEGSGGTGEIYVNGVQQGLSTDTAGASGLSSDSADLIIGNNSGGSRGFAGMLADFKFFPSALSTELKQLSSKINYSTDLITSTNKLWASLLNGSTADSGPESNTIAYTDAPTNTYDAFSVDVYDGYDGSDATTRTTTDGTFTVTQGKVEGLALSSLAFDGTNDRLGLGNGLTVFDGATQGAFSAWVRRDATGASHTIISHYDSTDSNRQFIFLVNGSDKAEINVQNDKSSFTSGHVASGTTTISANEWYHIVGTFSTTNGQKIYVNGVHEATAATTIEDALDTVTSQANIASFEQGGSYSNYFNGDIKDLKLYTQELSADQVASLYSNTLPITPEHNWKLDDSIQGVTTDTAVDSGTTGGMTGTIAGITASGEKGEAGVDSGWQNGTLDLDGNLTVEANGTLSAPRGNIEFSTAGTANTWDDNSTNGFIGNGGSLVFVGGGNKDFYGNSGTGYANIVSDGSNSNIRWRESATCTGITINSGGFLTPKGDNFTITCTGNIVNNGTWKFSDNSSNGITVAGASATSPAVCSGNEWNFNSESTASICLLKDLDFQFNITTGNATGAGAVTLRLTGDCEFDAVTVSSGDSLDLNGQRAEFSGQLDVNGSFKDITTTGASLIVAESLNVAGSSSNNTETTAGERLNLILNNTGSDDTNMFYSASGIYYDNIFVNGGEFTSYAGFGNQHTENFRIGSTFDVNHNWEMKNLSVCTGGNLDAGSSTLNCSGDFTTSGGLIGKSALNLTGSEEVTGSDNLDEVATTNKFTIEAWFKASTDANYRAIFSRGTSWGTGNLYVYMNADGNVQASSHDLSNTLTSTTAGLADSKWHHVAYTYDTTTIKLYIDGKLEATAASTSGINTQTAGFKIGDRDGANWVGNIGRVSVWKNALSETLIRKMFFMDWTTMAADSDFTDSDAIGWWQFDEGTSTAVEDLSSQSNDGTLNSAAWAGAGTFTYGTSTLVMAKSGTQTLNYRHVEEIYNLTINDGSTTQIQSIGDANGLLDINNNLTVNEKLKSHADSAQARIRIASAAKTITIGSDVKTTALSELYSMEIEHSGSTNVPELTTPRLLLDNTATAVATGNLTITEELDLKTGTTFNANGNTITGHVVDVNSGTLDLRNSTLNIDNGGALAWHDTGSTILSGNTTITGYSSAAKPTAYLPAAGNYEIVGDVKWMKLDTDSDLTVIGAVIDCDASASGANIRQWHHTLDTQQLLDADEAGDDDLRLTKPALDNALELMTK